VSDNHGREQVGQGSESPGEAHGAAGIPQPNPRGVGKRAGSLLTKLTVGLTIGHFVCVVGRTWSTPGHVDLDDPHWQAAAQAAHWWYDRFAAIGFLCFIVGLATALLGIARSRNRRMQTVNLLAMVALFLSICVFPDIGKPAARTYRSSNSPGSQPSK